jgi:hypothetical protein
MTATIDVRSRACARRGHALQVTVCRQKSEMLRRAAEVDVNPYRFVEASFLCGSERCFVGKARRRRRPLVLELALRTGLRDVPWLRLVETLCNPVTCLSVRCHC